MSGQMLARPSDDELRFFAEMRCRDDVVRRMYVALAHESAAWVGRAGDEAIGLAFASSSDDETVIHELFVRPAHRRAGIGSRLLEEATRDAGPRFAMLDAADAGSLAFALRHGLPMSGVVLRCAGAIPREEELLALAASEGRRLDVAALDVAAQRHAIDALEREIRGAPVGADHAILNLLASGTAFFYNGELVGYAYVWPDGRIGPMLSSSHAYEEQLFAYALAALGRRYGASWTQCLIPGENVRMLRSAVRCGLAVETVWLAARESFAGDPSRYVACHPLLY